MKSYLTTSYCILSLASGAMLLPLLTARPALADERPSLVGTWKVVSFEAVSPTTGEREPARGQHPTGYTLFTPGGRMVVLITNEGRTAPNSDQDRANLFLSMVAYVGTYRIDGDKWTTRVDVAANPALLGTEQERSFKLEGNRLRETTGLMSWAIHPEKGMVRFVITYERAE